MSDSLRPHGLQHAKLPCPSPTPVACSSTCPSNHLILSCPLLFVTSIFPSIRVFANESVPRIRWPKYWSFSFSISPSYEYSGLISFRMDWVDLAVQGTLKSHLHYHSSKASILQHSAFFIVQLSHPYMTTGKTIALTRQTFVNKVMSLLFNMLSSLVIAFLSRSKRKSLHPKSLQMVTAAMKLKDTYLLLGRKAMTNLDNSSNFLNNLKILPFSTPS